jgi:serine/threonine protein kinase/tetratricopeptide (TPR) repeat protein
LGNRARAALAFDPENIDALAFEAAAERALGPSVIGNSLEASAPSASSQPLPVFFKEGRYVVKKLLGEGANKRVYLVHDALLDRDVAYGLIKHEGLDDVGRERILREARAMASLGDHSNVVQLHDFGEESGQPYMVLPLMIGGDVESLLRSSPEHRLSPRQAIQIASDVCAGLEFAHSRGIVHRDLKPGNVWLTQDGTAKIGDFGLAVAADNSRLTQDGMILGTLLYMSPEQAMGGEVGPPTDLYSLGCMMYQMVTGRPPFQGDHPRTVIGQHLHTPPVSPRGINPEVPSGLEALIVSLLAKNPERRPESASEVRRALKSIVIRADGESSANETSTEAYDRSLLYRTTFVGRDHELGQLHSVFDSSLSGEGALAMVVGEPGIGKTALCTQLATYVALRGGSTLVGRCYEEGFVSLPYLPFVEVLREHALEQDADSLSRHMGSGAADLARIVTEIRERLDVKPNPPGDAEVDRYHLIQAVASGLRNASRDRPLLVVLEDLHNADKGTLDMLLHLTRNLSGARLLVVGTYRDIEVHRGHPLSSTLTELRRATPICRIGLRGLEVEEVRQMMSSIAAKEVSLELAEAVQQQTEGNPLFVQEVLRYLAEEGKIIGEDRWIDGQAALSIDIPEGLRDVIGKRLSHLSAQCNRVLRAAAVIGQTFRLDVLQQVADMSEDDLFATLEEAKAVAVLDEHHSVGAVPSFSFTHAFFRQTLYEENITPRRIRLHQQVGRAIEVIQAGRLDDHATELAVHFANSSDPEDLAKALRYSERAAKNAIGVYAYAEGVRLTEHALQVHEVLGPEDNAKHCDLLIELGNVLLPAGEPRRAFEEVAPHALSLAEALDDRLRASAACQLALSGLTRYGSGTLLGAAEYRHWAELANTYAGEETLERVRADSALSAVRYAEEQREESWGLARRALKLARQLEDPETLFLAALGILGRPQAPHRQDEQMAVAQEFSDRSRDGVSARTMGVVLHLSGYLQLAMAMGQRDQAEGLWRDLEELANRTRDSDLLLLSLSNEPLVATLDGHLERALESGARLYAKSKELGSPVLGRQFADEAGFRPLLYLGRAEEALAGLTRACDMAGVKPSWEVSLQRVLCLAHLDQRAEARDALGDLLQQRDIGPEADETPATFLAALLEAAVLIGDRDAAEVLAHRLADLSRFAADSSYLTCIARHLGGAAALSGRPDQARNYYETAIKLTEKIRHRPEAALSRFELSRLLFEKYPDQSGEARKHLDFAIAEFRDMKMVSALDRASKNGTHSS